MQAEEGDVSVVGLGREELAGDELQARIAGQCEEIGDVASAWVADPGLAARR